MNCQPKSFAGSGRLRKTFVEYCYFYYCHHCHRKYAQKVIGYK